MESKPVLIHEDFRKAIAKGLLSVCLIVIVAVFFYWKIIFPPANGTIYPWGSDTLGHVYRAAYLLKGIADGNLLPTLYPDWYLGIQLLRYYPPLPYYFTIFLEHGAGNLIQAVNWLIFISALTGGLFCLLFQKWIGWPLATLAGVYFLILPDNIRVAFAEGNLSRVIATAILPMAFYMLMEFLNSDRQKRKNYGIALALVFSVLVLLHAMMAAIYAVVFGVFTVLTQLKQGKIQTIVSANLFIGFGLLLSGWWLLPSLTGGITELSSSAVTKALTTFTLEALINPLGRTSNPEILYVGLGLIILPVLALFSSAGRSQTPLALTLVGLGGVMIVTPSINELYNSLPLHDLLWPGRFLGIASFLLLLALLWSIHLMRKTGVILLAFVVITFVIDARGSIRLIYLRPLSREISNISVSMGELHGWREATLDFSKLGSTTSYYFSTVSKREQVFGWAYQGARTASTVASINSALETGYWGFLVDRLNLIGTDDVVLLKQVASAPEVAASLAGAGFERVYSGETADLFHRDGSPRAIRARWKALGIGRGARNLAFVFPQMIVGTSPRVDDYPLDELLRFDTLVLSGFNWHDRQTAEDLVKEAAQNGVRVVVDLTGVPDDPLARIPKFLGVWGERIILAPEPVQVYGAGGALTLQPFGKQSALWYTFTPQGVEDATLSFDYLGESATLVGSNSYGKGKVWFIGINLPFHLVKTQDPAGEQLLSDLLRIPASTPMDYQTVPLVNYHPAQDGYTFKIQLEAPDRLLVPVARHEGSELTIDGEPAPIFSYENMIVFDAPAGNHEIEIKIRPTPIYLIGKLVSLMAIMSLIVLFVRDRRYSDVQSP